MPVTATHRDYKRFVKLWKKCRDLLAGEDELKNSDNCKEYIPPLSGHAKYPKRYKPYVDGAVLYDATGRTFEGLLGLIQRKPPDIKLPSKMKPFEEDCTGTGISLAEFCGSLADEVLRVGRAGILIDFPSEKTDGMTAREIEEAGIQKRPFLTLYTAESIRKWWTRNVGGVYKLVKLVLSEQIEAAGEDEFETDFKTRYRVMDLVQEVVAPGSRKVSFRLRVRFFVEDPDKKGEWVQEGKDLYPVMGDEPIREIPFVFANARSTTWTVSKPPLMGMVSLNLNHFKTTAAYEHGLALAGSPTPWVSGFKRGQDYTGVDATPDDPNAPVEFVMGGGVVWTFGNAQAKVDKLSFSADDLAALEKALGRKEEQMVVVGSRILSPEERAAPESGKAKEVEREGENSALTTISNMCSKAMTAAAVWARNFYLGSGEVSVTLNTDFFTHPLTPEEAIAVVELWQKHRVYGKSDARRLLRRGEWIDRGRSDEDIDTELDEENILTGQGQTDPDLEDDDEDVPPPPPKKVRRKRMTQAVGA